MATNEMHNSQQNSNFQLTDLMTYLWQKKFRILFTALLIVGLGAYHITHLPKIYQASSILLLGSNSNKISLPSTVASLAGSGDSEIDTYVEFIRSKSFVGYLVDDLELTKLPSFRSKLPNANATRDRDYAISLIQHNLVLNRLGDTFLLKVSYESLSPQVAADVVNQLGPSFFTFYSEMGRRRADNASKWLNNQLKGLQDALSKAEETLQNYLKDNQLMDVGRQVDLMQSEISGLLTERLEHEKNFSKLRDIYLTVNASKNDEKKLLEIPYMQTHPLVMDLRTRIFAQQQIKAEISNRYKSKHHKFIAVESMLKTLQKELGDLLAELIAGLQQEFDRLSNRSVSLQSQIKIAKSKHSELGSHSLQIAKLRRELASTQKLYEAFLARLQETEILKDLGKDDDFAVVDIAAPPSSPSKPNVTLSLVMLAVFSVLISSVFWVSIHLISDRQTRYRFLLKKQGIAILGELPKPPKSKKPGPKSSVGLKKPHNKAQVLYAEAVRSLRSELMLRFDSTPLRIIAITSVQHGKQRSKLAIELAESFGHLEKSILVDADLRSPQIGVEYGFDQLTPGLTNFISRRSLFSESIYREKGRQLSVMPSGAVPSDPLVYFTKPRFGSFIKKLGVLFERVIIDTSPVNAFSDALVISKTVDAVVLLCDLDVTERVDLLEAVQRLQDSGAPLLGVVFEQAKNVKSKLPTRSLSKRLGKKVINY